MDEETFDFLDDNFDINDESINSKMSNIFKPLEESLNLPEGSTKLKNKPKEIRKNTEVAVKDASNVIKNDLETFEDKIFIQDTLKRVIIKVESMLDNVESELNMGGEPRMYEVYATMVKSLNDSIEKLMNLQKQAEMSNVMKNQPLDEGSSKKVVLEEKKTIKMSGRNFAEILNQISEE